MERQERHILDAFSKELLTTYFHHVPPNTWKVERILPHYWLFGVKQPHLDTYPYLFSLHFDWKNHLWTLHLEHEVMKATVLLPHVYHRLVFFLTEQKWDVCVRNDNAACKPSLYPKNQLPLHATGPRSTQLLTLLQVWQNHLPNTQLYFWKEESMLHMTHPRMHRWHPPLSFYIGKGEKPTSGLLIDDVLYPTKEAIQTYLTPIQTQLHALQQEEQALLRSIQEQTPCYYDPTTDHLMIFQQPVAYWLKLCVSVNEHTTYVLRFDETQTQNNTLAPLLESAQAHIHAYIQKNRLQAVIDRRY